MKTRYYALKQKYSGKYVNPDCCLKEDGTVTQFNDTGTFHSPVNVKLFKDELYAKAFSKAAGSFKGKLIVKTILVEVL